MEGQRATYSLMALQQDLPNDLPSWAFEVDVLGGFEDFMDITFDPNALEGLEAEAADEVATGNAPADPELSGAASRDVSHAQQELSAGDPAANPSSANSGVLRKQQKNREAQHRFRMRQRVGLSVAVSIFILMSIARLPLHATLVVCLLGCLQVAVISMLLQLETSSSTSLAGSHTKSRSADCSN